MTVDRLDLAERHLDRMNAFHSRIDAKVAAVAAWLSLELAVVALNTRLPDLRIGWLWLPFGAYLVALTASAFWLWKAVFPDTRGGTGSLVYFAGIAAMTEAEFRRDYLAIADEALLEDLAAQIWRNAEIVCDKYRAVQAAIRWATLSLLLLIATLVGTSLIHQALPRLTGD